MFLSSRACSPSSPPAAQCPLLPGLCSHCHFLSVTRNLLVPGDPHDDTGLTCIIQDNPHPRTLHLIPSSNSLLPCQVTYTWIPDIGVCMCLGGHYPARHTSHEIIMAPMKATPRPGVWKEKVGVVWNQVEQS